MGSESVKEKSVSVILLAGGKGKRMGASMPKQYLPLLGQPIALYSLFKEIQTKWLVLLSDTKEKIHVDLKFAFPGKERQDSVYSGLQVHALLLCTLLLLFLLVLYFCVLLFHDDHIMWLLYSFNKHYSLANTNEYQMISFLNSLSGKTCMMFCFQAVDLNSELVCIHDSARPLVTPGDVKKVLKDGWLNGAAVLGVPAKATIKEANSESFVVRTLDRRTLWEMQTPQVIKPEEGLEVTDDVSIVEHLKHPVYITEGSYTNIKVTTPDDLLLAERILSTS
ncbi:hypothetical protein RHGRI_032106 [Rhododendron griersonianum]|uniref:2-C-methyl-D-erythritol 4-phosphate cytidylyltransferase n=1 Tax=Rhododendron griersonianum TaxID=479676 RepID=A0AAV6IB91_9ERIC|nr:hypothetical protein RHGRI_032106 [Rhododendron griersonianum]